MEPSTLELSPDTMRALGYRAVDLLVDRISGLDAAPAWRGAGRAIAEAALAGPPPDRPAWERPTAAGDRGAAPADAFSHLLDRLRADVLEVAGRIDHPRFFAFVPSCPLWPAVLGDFLAAGFNVFQGTWLESAGPSALELVVLDWFRGWLGLPSGTEGVLTSGGSAANLIALACARQARARGSWREATLYVSEQTHSSVLRAARVLGFEPAQVRTVPTDREHRMDIAACRAALKEDGRRGLRPLVLIANAGATSTGAVDDLAALAVLADQAGAWLHVDAAYGGFAALTSEGAAALVGIERADSVTLDPHKWLFQPYEAGCLLVREGERLREAFHVLPDYLQDTATTAGEVNFADRGVQLTRSARAVKIWLSVQFHGLDAIREAIQRGIDLARLAEERVRESPAFELLSPARLGIVCFRRVGGEGADGSPPDEERLEARNARLVTALAASGIGMISSTRLDGRYALRLCVLNYRSRPEDVERVIRWLETA